MAEGDAKQGNAVVLVMAALLLTLCFVCGGDSAEGNVGATAGQLLAIPILIVAFAISARDGRLRNSRLAVCVTLSILFLPLLQLLPLPSLVWEGPSARLSLLQDLNAAGVAIVDQRWSLSPSASERSFHFLLPGAALFFCMLAVGPSGWRRMLGLIVGLGVANLVFAFVQFAAGQKSVLNPYPDFAPALGGIFANNNHQADMLAVGLLLVVVFLMEAWKRLRMRRGSGVEFGILVFLAIVLMCVLPLVGSRAGVIIAMLMLVGAFLGGALPTMQAFRESRPLQIGSVLALVILVVGLQAAVGWMKNEATDSAVGLSRYRIATETLAVGAGHAPLGAGFGTFIPAFQQDAGDDFLMRAYVNNAHNEYAQWWLEGGVAGALLILLALIALVGASVRLLRLPADSATRTCGLAAMMGTGVILLHSTVDYPLRSPALTAVFAVLAGVAVAAATRPATRRHRLSRRERTAVAVPGK